MRDKKNGMSSFLCPGVTSPNIVPQKNDDPQDTVASMVKENKKGKTDTRFSDLSQNNKRPYDSEETKSSF